MEFLLILLTSILLITLVVSAIAFILGIIKPDLILKFRNEENRNRKGVLVTFAPVIIASFTLLAILSTKAPDRIPSEQIELEESVDSPEELKLTEEEQNLFLKQYSELSNPDLIRMIKIHENIEKYNEKEQNIINEKIEGLEEDKVAFKKQSEEEKQIRDTQIEEERKQKETEHNESQAKKIQEMKSKNMKVPPKKSEKAPTQQESSKQSSTSKVSSGYTLEQENAIGKAKSYLDFSSFSRSGLISQLEYEGFSNEDADLAVSQINIDWPEQAVEKAESYISYASFSRIGLIEQLEYEGFSYEDAEYAVNQIGF